MPVFKGFPEGKFHLTPVPSLFFTELLPHMDQLGEVKLTLYIFWRLDHMEGAFRYLRRTDSAFRCKVYGRDGRDHRGGCRRSSITPWNRP